MKPHNWTHHTSAGFTPRGHHSAPSGRPVIHFLHGNGLSSLTYAPLLARLEEDFDLFLSDVQGHGDSDHGSRFRGWNHAAEMAAEAWLAHAPRFGPVPVHAAGHSFGSVLTCLMLAHHPQTFSRAVLLDPVLFSPALIGMMALSDLVGLASRNKLAAGARNRRHHWPDRRTAHANLHGRGVFRGWREDCFQAYIDHALRDVPGGGVELDAAPVDAGRHEGLGVSAFDETFKVRFVLGNEDTLDGQVQAGKAVGIECDVGAGLRAGQRLKILIERTEAYAHWFFAKTVAACKCSDSRGARVDGLWWQRQIE